MDFLRGRTQKGDEYTWFQRVASALNLNSHVSDIYKSSGVDSFKSYIHKAHQAGVIDYDDVNKLIEKRYLRLHSRLR